MNPNFYTGRVQERGASALRGNVDQWHEASALRNLPVLNAFLDDDDLQEITICSTNLGLVLTYTKERRPLKETDE